MVMLGCQARMVRTLPPTTAALSDGERKHFGGIRTSIGLRHPWLSGISSDIRGAQAVNDGGVGDCFGCVRISCPVR
jgi:hypothetical protein